MTMKTGMTGTNKRMLYLCPVDWRWIKQRPQFLAEELTEHFSMHVLYPFANKRSTLQKKQPSPVRPHPWFTLPTLGGRVPGISKVNDWLFHLQTRLQLCLARPDFLWVSMPWQLPAIPRGYRGTVVYDCMDDYPAITMDAAGREALIAQEKQLVERADVIFVSSENLMHELQKRYGVSAEKMTLLRNGYHAGWTKAPDVRTPDGSLKIGYFGTIGRWFDFPLLLESLEAFPQIEYHLFGPAEKGMQAPQHERIHLHGVLPHAQIPEKAAGLDVLMMPFQLNDIVRSVDPVKLYEYLFLQRNILCVRYPEINRYEPFVCFYETPQEYCNQIRRLLSNNSLIYTAEGAQAFLQDNSWSCRAKTAAERLTKAGQ